MFLNYDFTILTKIMFSKHLIIALCKVEFIQPYVGLFRAKFACNSAIRYPVFKWELCKGCV